MGNSRTAIKGEGVNRFLGIALIMILLFSLVSCSGADPEKDKAPEKTRRFIIDTDSGADDSAALILAASDSDITIEGVTVLVGNVDLDTAAQNALMALETAGSSVPVYKGAAESVSKNEFEPYSVFGEDGMGDADLVHPSGKAEDKDAVDFILETVKKYPGEIEIIMLGPATNIANAIQKDPETMKNVKMIWTLGTAGLGPGNATPVAEFNVYEDAEAYSIMLESGVPVTVIGFDMCGGDAMWTDEDFKRLEASGDAGEFVSGSLEKIRLFYSKNGNDKVSICDPEAVMCAIEDDFIKDTKKCHASCITEKGETYGEVLFYWEGFTYDMEVPTDFDYNTTLVTDIDSAGYFDRYLKAIKQIK